MVELNAGADVDGAVLLVQRDDRGGLLRVILNVQGMLAELPAEETSLFRSDYRPGDVVPVRIIAKKEAEGEIFPVPRLVVSESAREFERLLAERAAPKTGKSYPGRVVQVGERYVRVKLRMGAEVLANLPSLNYKGREKMLAVGSEVVVYVTRVDRNGTVYGTTNWREAKSGKWEELSEGNDVDAVFVGVRRGKYGEFKGLNLNVEGFRAFLPIEETSYCFVKDVNYRPGDLIPVRILKKKETVVDVNGWSERRRLLIVSKKAREFDTWKNDVLVPEPGSLCKGEVVFVGPYYLRVRLNSGLDVLVKDPKKDVFEGEKVPVYITRVDRKSRRIYGSSTLRR